MAWLQEWYSQQCDGTWELQHGVVIETLDNPGWLVKVDLTGTAMHGVSMEVIHQGATNHEGINGEQEWLHCKLEGDHFVGAGGPMSLLSICETFKLWVEQSSSNQK